MLIKWTQKISDPKEKEDFKKLVNSASPVLRRLDEVIDEFVEMAQMTTGADYDCPSWAFKQAHLNGFIEGLQKLKPFLREDKSQQGT